MLIFLSQVLSAQAGSVQSILEYQARFQSVYQGFVFPSPEKIFDSAYSLSRFYRDVKKGQCGTSLVELSMMFHEKYPEMPDPTEFKGGGFGAWYYIIKPRDYPELLFCETMQDLNKVQQKIKEQGITGTLRFQQFRQPKDPDIELLSPLNSRVSSIGNILSLAMFNYAPAQVALAALSEKGDVVRLTPAYAYYLLSRAKRLGYKASDLAPLLEKAIAALSADERQQLTARIKSGDWPGEERRVVD